DIQLPFNAQFKSFISYPLVSEKHGNVGSVILASTSGFSLRQRLKETLFIISTRLAHELEQSIIAENKQRDKIELARKLEAAREEERKTIARDIHDDLGGSLAALKIDISLLSKRLKKTNTDEAIASKLTTMNTVVEKSIKDMRNIINNLRLGILDDIGIIEAIEWTLRETEDRHHISTCFISDLLTSDIESGLEEAARTSLFRMINEAITNVVKHAQATSISVELFKEDRQIVTRIIDDGQGIKKKNTHKNSYGIIGMQERVDLLNGEIEFSSPTNGGTQIEIRIPTFRENIT
ncbi:MAG: sensor histidine kinase, partial [Gammaproteobacteria bacterium]|nr:sensor histidine kinase [Gammaproteobacteria bacterium]